jgi:Di-haem oxidoreductase, putative peroxidase
MRLERTFIGFTCGALTVASLAMAGPARAQLRDVFQAPNPINEGIHKTFAGEVGAGRGDAVTPGSSLFIIGRDPFRAVRRGRQVFQRKFLLKEGLWDERREGGIAGKPEIGAGLADSCAGCHGRPRGSPGHGGNVFTRPDSRDARHLFGLGLQEMLADETTGELRAIRADALATARATRMPQTVGLFTSNGLAYGELTARPNGSVNLAGLEGIDADLRVRPFLAQGGSFAIREIVVDELAAEMGLEAPDIDLLQASRGGRVTTPSGLVLDGRVDRFDAPPVATPAQDGDGDGKANEIPLPIVDYLESFLLNSFQPASGQLSVEAQNGRAIFTQIGCASCHVPNLAINRDRRIVDVETAFDPVNGGPFNGLFASVTSLVSAPAAALAAARPVLPPLQPAAGDPFLVRNFFADLKRHDLGPAFYERNFDGSLHKTFMTAPLWGVATTAPYGHDGRSVTVEQAILRHGGEAQDARDVFASLSRINQLWILDFLGSLELFPPDDTASSLQRADPTAGAFPQTGHGAIALTPLFVNPRDLE